MHIEPGVLQGAKMFVAYGTGTAALTAAAALYLRHAKTVVTGAHPDPTAHRAGLGWLGVRTLLAIATTFACFEVLPHQPVGVSEVHLILGVTMFLLFGVAPAAVGLATGLLLQGVFFAPHDLPQYFANVTTLLVPLFATAALARRLIPAKTPYHALRYRDLLKLSLAFQGGVVAWVAFWAFFGLGVEATSEIAAFARAYVAVILAEPLIDLGVLALAKRLHAVLGEDRWVQARLYGVAA